MAEQEKCYREIEIALTFQQNPATFAFPAFLEGLPNACHQTSTHGQIGDEAAAISAAPQQAKEQAEIAKHMTKHNQTNDPG